MITISRLAVAGMFSAMMLVLAAPAAAQTTGTSTTVGSADRDWAVTAAEANNGEIALAKLALQKTQDPAVRMFAERMIADHSKAGAQLTSIAQSQSIKLPPQTTLTQADQQTEQMLSGLNSHPFDVQYINSQITDHNVAIALFQKEAQNGTDPALKQFAEKTLPTLQAHLRLAQQAQQQVAPQ